jgi:membrane protease YdiL (CAAX protease family)
MIEVIFMIKQKNIIWIPALYILALLLVNILTLLLISIMKFDGSDMETIRIGTISNLTFYIVLFYLYIALYKNSWKQSFNDFLKHSQRHLTTISIGLIAMFSAMMIMGYLYTLLGIVESPENQQILEMQLSGSLFDKISLILFAVFLAPLVEETLFRLSGFYLLKKYLHFSSWMNILFTALLFGSVHVLGDNYIQVLYYAALGIVLGFLYHKSHNIFVPIIVHMIFNSFVMISMFLA